MDKKSKPGIKGVKYKKRTLRLPGNMKLDCFVIKESFQSKIILKPTDDTWEYYHLVLMITPKSGNVQYQQLAGIISRPELDDVFKFDHLNKLPT